MVKALFSIWSEQEDNIKIDEFCLKMVMFGLAPDIKIINEVTNTVF